MCLLESGFVPTADDDLIAFLGKAPCERRADEKFESTERQEIELSVLQATTRQGNLIDEDLDGEDDDDEEDDEEDDDDDY